MPYREGSVEDRPLPATTPSPSLHPNTHTTDRPRSPEEKNATPFHPAPPQRDEGTQDSISATGTGTAVAATTTASTLEEDDLIDIDPPASRGADLLLSLTKATRHKPLVTPPLLDASSSSLLVVAGETGFSTNNNNSSNMVYNNASNNASNNNSRMRMMRPPDAENPHRMLYHSPIKVNPHNTTSSSACAVSEQHPNKLRKQPLGSLLTEPQNQYHHHPGVSSARNLPYGMGRQVPSWSPSCVPGRMGQQQAVFHASFGAASPTVSSSSANSNSVPKRLMLFADTDQRTVTVRSSPTVTTKRMRETKSEEKKDTEEGLVPDDDEEDEEEPQQQQPNHNMAEEEPPIVKQRLISPSSSNEKLEEADATPAPSTTTNTNTTTTSTAAATHAFVVDPAVPPLGFYGGHTLWPPPPHPNSMYHPTPPPPHAHPWPHAPYPGAAAYYHPHGPPPTPHYGTAYPYPSPGWGAVYSPGVFPPPDQQQQQQHPSRSSLRSSKDPWKGLTGGGGSSNNLNRCVPIANPVPNKYWSSSANNTTNNTLERSVLPDFTRIVNFPDFLSRGRHGDKSIPHKGGGGERHCVMCGQSRRCSAAAASENASTTRRPKQQQSMDNSCTSHDAMSDLATHIIPRQNKGVCTVCDVAVWMFRDPEGPCNNNNGGLEIKWCKGCKNFRPWEAFGDKGAATKCARCRQRQRDKYATQKIESSRLAEETELKA